MVRTPFIYPILLSGTLYLPWRLRKELLPEISGRTHRDTVADFRLVTWLRLEECPTLLQLHKDRRGDDSI